MIKFGFTEEGSADLSDFGEIKPSNIEGFSFDNGNSQDCSLPTLNYKSLEYLKKVYTPIFLRYLREEHFEAGYANALDNLVDEIVKRDPIIAANWLADIHIKNISTPRVLLGVLFVISRIEETSIRTSLSVIAFGALAHSDVEIRETAIRCFENWGDSYSLDCLKNTNSDSVNWIEDYKKQVIKDIEEVLN